MIRLKKIRDRALQKQPFSNPISDRFAAIVLPTQLRLRYRNLYLSRRFFSLPPHFRNGSAR
jgi:hypothetical protein